MVCTLYSLAPRPFSYEQPWHEANSSSNKTYASLFVKKLMILASTVFQLKPTVKMILNGHERSRVSVTAFPGQLLSWQLKSVCLPAVLAMCLRSYAPNMKVVELV